MDLAEWHDVRPGARPVASAAAETRKAPSLHVERVTRIELALSAWEVERLLFAV